MKSVIIALVFCFVATTFVNAQVSKEEQSSLRPKQVLVQLLEGNRRFVAGESTVYDNSQRIAKTAHGQYPKAVILSCLDSRVPVEMIFDQGIGDIFVGRVAGNIENDDQLGSMEFATKVAGSKLVMVLGHTHCGAVKGACDGVKLGNLTALLSEIQPAVDAVTGFQDSDRNSKNTQFVQQVIEKNVHKTVADIRERSPILADLEASGQIKIVGALYDLHTGRVRLLD